jgi:hypothetical protein
MAARGRGDLVPLERSGRLSDRQRSFLSRMLVDPTVQQLIPSSVVTETIEIGPQDIGLLLTHQPLIARFHHNDYHRLSEFLSGCRNGSSVIFPTGYDYDLTHTLYYLVSGGSRRSIATEELSIPGVELTGACVLGRREMAVFLEEVVVRCSRSSVARVNSYSDIGPWLRVVPPGRQYDGSRKGLCLEDGEEEFVGHLRMDCSLRLDTKPSVWVEHLGMDWPEYFFAHDEVVDAGDKG